MQYIFFCNPKKIFSFDVSLDVLKVLGEISEQYVITHIGKRVKTLEYLKMFM